MNQNQITFNKIISEYVKHITTLSTASILLLISFIDKIFDTPFYKWLFVLSIISFLISIVSGVLLTTVSLYNPDELEEGTFLKTLVIVSRVSFPLLVLSFIIGVCSLGAFGVF